MVVFEFTVKPGQEQAYFAFADDLQPILGKIDGFLGVERYQSPFDRNKFVSISTPLFIGPGCIIKASFLAQSNLSGVRP